MYLFIHVLFDLSFNQTRGEMKKQIRKLFSSNCDYGGGQKKKVLGILLYYQYCYYYCVASDDSQCENNTTPKSFATPGPIHRLQVYTNYKLCNVRPNGFSKHNPNAVYLRSNICAMGMHSCCYDKCSRTQEQQPSRFPPQTKAQQVTHKKLPKFPVAS